MQLRCEILNDLQVENVKTQWLTSTEWDCPRDDSPKLAVGQPNSSLTKLTVSHQTFVLMKTSSRRLSSSSSEDVLKTASRCLNQEEHIRLSHTSSEDVFKTSWSRPIYSSKPYVVRTYSRHFWDVLKTSSTRFQDVFKTSCKNNFQKSSRRLRKISSRSFQDVSSS